MKYHATITGWGDEAFMCLSGEPSDFIVIFNDNAPDILKEISVLHTIEELHGEPAPGDIMVLCGKVFDITAVGEEAKQTLKLLGHCTLSFAGGDEPERPGCIMLKGDVPLTASDIKLGETIEIY